MHQGEESQTQFILSAASRYDDPLLSQSREQFVDDVVVAPAHIRGLAKPSNPKSESMGDPGQVRILRRGTMRPTIS